MGGMCFMIDNKNDIIEDIEEGMKMPQNMENL